VGNVIAPHRGDPRRSRPPRRRSRWRTGDWAVDLSCLGIALMGFNRWRIADYPASDFVFVVVAAIIVMRLLTGRSRTLAPAESRHSSTLIMIGSLIMLTAGALSSFGAWNPLASVGVVLRLAWLTLIWFWVLRSIASTREVFNRLLWAWWVALILNAFITVTGELGLTNFSAENIEGRQTGFYGHANDLAGFLLAGLPLVVFGVPRRDDGSTHPLIWRLVAIGLLGYAIATTGSMSAVAGAVVGIAVTVVVIVVTRNPGRRRRRHPLLVMAITCAVGIGLVFLTSSDLPIITRITEFAQGGSGVNDSVEQRGVRNQYVLDRLDELLVIGIGLDHQSLGKIAMLPEGPSSPDDIGVHNMYLKVFLESGLPGLIGLWVIVGTSLVQAWRLMLNTRNETLHTTVAALFGSMVMINVFAMFQPTLYHRFYWLPIALVSVLWALRRHELRQGLVERSPVPRRAATAPVAPV
jgi:O-antigen ligase